jgi:hypothetical protein
MIGIYDSNPKIVTRGLKLWVDAGWYNSYSGSGTAWNNLAATTSNGVLNGPIYSSSNGGLFDFDGTNDFCHFGQAAAIRPTAAISVELWVKFDALTSNVRFSSDWHQAGIGDRWIWYQNSSTEIWWYMRTTANGSDGQVSLTGVATNTWYHLIGTFGDGFQTMYVNGAYHNRRTLTGSLPSGANEATAVRIGIQRQAGGALNGQVSQFRIYDVCLTTDEVKQNYDAHKLRY